MLPFFKKIQKIEELPPRLKNLYNHYILRNTGFALLTMFGPIFLYEIGGSLEFIIYIWLTISFFYFLSLPLFVKLLQFFSMHIFLIIGTIFAAIYLGVYYLFSISLTENIIFLVVIFILFNVLNRLFYWVPYNVDFARFIDRHHHGRRISFLWIIISLIGILTPLFSAFVIDRFGFPVLFLFSIFIVIFSIISAFFIPRTREKYSFKYFESFKKIFSKDHIKTNIAYMADGWQSGIGYFIWPIFIFIILKGNFLNVGFVSAGIILITCVLRYVIGEITDKFDKQKLLKRGSILYAVGWIFKALSTTALHVFLAGAYHNFVYVLIRTPFDALNYEIAADQGHYVDEFSVLREMSLHIGRVSMFLTSLILLNFFSIIWIFIFGAIVSFLLSFITKEEFVY